MFDDYEHHKPGEGFYYARVASVNHVIVDEHGDLLFFMEIKADPPISGERFPTINHSGIQSEMNLHAVVQVDDAYIPRAMMLNNRNRSHFRVENEVSRFKESMEQVKRIVEM